MINLDELIRGTFDFEYPDQPDNIEGYEGLVKFMWLQCAVKGVDEKMYERIKEIAESKDEPEQTINFLFLPGKNDTRNLLRYANNYYEKVFLFQKKAMLDELSSNLDFKK
jgi:hypothetical protein